MPKLNAKTIALVALLMTAAGASFSNANASMISPSVAPIVVEMATPESSLHTVKFGDRFKKFGKRLKKGGKKLGQGLKRFGKRAGKRVEGFYNKNIGRAFPSKKTAKKAWKEVRPLIKDWKSVKKTAKRAWSDIRDRQRRNR